MRAEILTIGTELLLGKGLNLNAPFIAERLTEAGIRVDFITTIGDEKGRIEAAFKLALERADVIVATGGLGPTEDDLTREALSAALGRPLILNERVLERIRRRFAERGLPMSRNNEKQALVPEGAELFENPRGTAPGLYIPIGRKAIVALPGVPSEMRPMLIEQVIPRLRRAFGLQGSIRTRILKLSGIAESQVDELIGDLMRVPSNPAITLLAHPGEVHVVLVAKGGSEGELERFLQRGEEKVRERLQDFIFGRDEERLEEMVGCLLQSQGKKVAVAESLTGGLVAHRLTNVPGSAACFEGGVVACSEKLQEDLLGVPSQLLRE
ncbi:MAG: CinA family nicotinamide mononucleotide deamidase-related protein, partial [Candidatus Methylomirabilales bacterium]